MLSPAEGSRLLLFAALLVAACQPLPHPFAHDVPPPGSPLMSLPDSVSLSVAPVRGAPRGTAQRLAAAMASALQHRQVAASAETASIVSDELSGVIEEAPAAGGSPVSVIARWRLADAKGRVIGARSARALAPAKDWRLGEKAAIARLAAASADAIARLLFGKAATASSGPLAPRAIPPSGAAPAQSASSRQGAARAPAPPPARPRPARSVRLFVGAVTGAPGDGGAALARAIRFFLGRRNIAVISARREKPDFVLDGNVAVGAEAAGMEHIKVLWRLLRPDGSEIGTVAQQNEVPARLLEGSWGDLAYLIADAAQQGILELLARGASAGAES
jgi:hypothetical protein